MAKTPHFTKLLKQLATFTQSSKGRLSDNCTPMGCSINSYGLTV